MNLVASLAVAVLLSGCDSGTSPSAAGTTPQAPKQANPTSSEQAPSSTLCKEAVEQESASFTCGGQGALEEKIKSCNTEKKSSDGKSWKLVSKLFGKEIWQSPSGNLWSYRLGGVVAGFRADEACKYSVSRELNLKEMEFRLPSYDDFIEADAEGIREVLSDMDHRFWTSDVTHPPHDRAQYNGRTGNKDGYYGKLDLFEEDAVRCIFKSIDE